MVRVDRGRGLFEFVSGLVVGGRRFHLDLFGRGDHLVGGVGVGQCGVEAVLGDQKALSGCQAAAATPEVRTLGQRQGLGWVVDK